MLVRRREPLHCRMAAIRRRNPSPRWICRGRCRSRGIYSCTVARKRGDASVKTTSCSQHRSSDMLRPWHDGSIVLVDAYTGCAGKHLRPSDAVHDRSARVASVTRKKLKQLGVSFRGSWSERDQDRGRETHIVAPGSGPKPKRKTPLRTGTTAGRAAKCPGSAMVVAGGTPLLGLPRRRSEDLRRERKRARERESCVRS